MVQEPTWDFWQIIDAINCPIPEEIDRWIPDEFPFVEVAAGLLDEDGTHMPDDVVAKLDLDPWAGGRFRGMIVRGGLSSEEWRTMMENCRKILKVMAIPTRISKRRRICPLCREVGFRQRTALLKHVFYGSFSVRSCMRCHHLRIGKAVLPQEVAT